MAEFTAHRLRLTSPYHSSSQGIGLERTDTTVRSDTLFSALASAVRVVRGRDRLGELLERARTDPPFLVSSAFPWAGEICFFPRPRTGPRYPDDGRQDDQKKRMAKVPWVSAGMMERFLASRPPALDEIVLDPHHDVCYLQSERQALPTGDGRWWAREAVPRVAVDRQTSASAIYRCGRCWYGPAAGLWFLVEWRDRSWEGDFGDALAYLGEAGLGGERSAGHGQFTVDRTESLRLADQPAGKGLLTLSLYHPTAAEVRGGVLASPAAYDLELRRGWVTSPEASTVWRKAVRMVVEGSVVRRVAPRLGDLVDVTPDGPSPHPVYRAGFALGPGCGLEGDAL